MPNSVKQNEAEFLETLRATFKIEAEEHLQTMYSGLLELEKTSAREKQQSIIETIFREVHSLKGAARAVNHSDVERICQPLEGVLAVLKRQERSPLPEDFDTLHRAIDTIGQLLVVSDQEQPAINASQVSQLIQHLGVIESGRQRSQTQHSPKPENFSVANIPRVESDIVSTGANETKQQDAASSTMRFVEPPTNPSNTPGKSGLAETIRISTDKLDNLLLKTEEMLTVKMAARQRSAHLVEASTMIESWKKEWARMQPVLRALRTAERKTTNGNSHPRLVHDEQAALLQFMDWNQACLKSLEEKLRSLSRSTEQDQHSLSKLVNDLLEDSKKLLMLPFSALLSVFPKLARDLSRDQDKQVEIVIKGGDVEIDKRILEELKDPLIHVLRNCIDHGIKSPAERSRLNKTPRANVTFSASRLDGSKVEIRVSDDGEGIDLERVKAAAVRRGIISEQESQALTHQEALALIFQSDVSSNAIITEISGRGLGLAIVREKVEKLGGRVLVEMQRQVGTTFRIVIPLTLATFRGVLVKTANQVFVIPAANVILVDRIKCDGIKTVGNRETISLDGKAVSLVRLEAVLELCREETNGQTAAFLPLVVLESGDERIAFAVDEVLNEEEVLVKPLGKPLARVRNVAGATVLGAGNPAPVLHVGDLLKSARKVDAPAMSSAPATEREAKRKSILVAEDSITSRMLLKNILESAGYDVRTTVDGVDALTTLKTGDFDLVVSDVEMPRMNGFDLTSKIRDDKRLADIPVVLVTALASPQDRERGVDAGADAYLVKRDFEQSNLLEAVRRLI